MNKKHDVILFVPNAEHTIFKMLFELNDVLIENNLNSKVMNIKSWSTNVSCSISVGLGGDKSSTKRGRITGDIIRHQKRVGDRHIVIDQGYVYKRSVYWSVGWDALNGRANFCNKNMDDKRINEWGIKFEPWKIDKKGFVLFCLQLPWDAAVNNVYYPTYVKDTVDKLLLSTKRKIIIREHPMIFKSDLQIFKNDLQLLIAHEYKKVIKDIMRHDRVYMTENENIKDDFDQAWCVVAYNSNSTVEAAMHGIPSFVADSGSMTWNISSHNLDIENPIRPERHQWLCDLSYSQWHGDEVARGLPFKQLGVIS
jgi:hypothetical protein